MTSLFSLVKNNSLKLNIDEIEVENDQFLKDRYVEFYLFIVERQKTWYNRFVLNKQPPWTNDPYISKYKFTNVYRELDKGTIYLIRRLKNIKKDRAKLLFNITLYRLFNVYKFFDEYIDGTIDPSEYDCYLFIDKLDKLRKEGKKIFSNAYMVPKGFVRKDYRPQDKHVQVAFMLEKFVNNIDSIIDEMDTANKPLESYKPLTRFTFLRDFISYEIWTDLTYFKFFKQGWTDNDFVVVGKGAIWGLNIMLGHDTSEPILERDKYVEMTYKLRDDMKTTLEKLGLHEEWMNIHYKNAFSNKPYLSLRNIEHSLCEYRKYWRIKNIGKVKKKYFRPTKDTMQPL